MKYYKNKLQKCSKVEFSCKKLFLHNFFKLFSSFVVLFHSGKICRNEQFENEGLDQ